MVDVTRADLAVMYLIQLARLRRKDPAGFVLGVLRKHYPGALMFDDLSAEQLDSAVRRAKLSIANEAASAAATV